MTEHSAEGVPDGEENLIREFPVLTGRSNQDVGVATENARGELVTVST